MGRENRGVSEYLFVSFGHVLRLGDDTGKHRVSPDRFEDARASG
jgi:hypothetical protein